MPEQLPPDDPITSRPMAGLVLISVFILMLTVSWSLYDEFYGLRPWRKYQAEFSSAYSNYLDKEYNQRKAAEQKFYATPEYMKLVADVKAATDAARTQDQEIGKQIDLLDQQRAAMTDSFTTSRGLVGSLTYQLEQISEKDKSGKDSKLKELNDAKAQTFDVAWPVGAGKIEQQKFNYDKLNGLFVSIMQSKAKLVAQRGDVDQPAKDAQDKLNEYVKENLPGLASKDLFSLSQSMKSLDIHIRQINVNPTGTSLNNLGRRGTRRSLPILPSRDGSADCSGDDDAYQSGPRCSKEHGRAVHQPPRSGHDEISSAGKIRLLSLPRRKWTRARHGREGPWPLRTLALAALL